MQSEGIATFIAGATDIKLGITLAIAISLHNIPEGIAIALPIYYATNNKRKAILYSMIAGLSEFVGALITCIFLKNFINNMAIGFLLSIIAGIMFQISIYELLPQANKLKERRVVIFFLTGCLIMYISSKII